MLPVALRTGSTLMSARVRRELMLFTFHSQYMQRVIALHSKRVRTDGDLDISAQIATTVVSSSHPVHQTAVVNVRTTVVDVAHAPVVDATDILSLLKQKRARYNVAAAERQEGIDSQDSVMDWRGKGFSM